MLASRMPLSITIDGQHVSVPDGTCVAAALWNHGVRSARASVRGEPRFALCGMGICYECRATINGVAHERTCMVPCAEGMQVTTPGRSPQGGAPV